MTNSNWLWEGVQKAVAAEELTGHSWENSDPMRSWKTEFAIISKRATFYLFPFEWRVIVVKNPTVFSNDYLNVFSGKSIMPSWISKLKIRCLTLLVAFREYGRTSEEGQGKLWFLENISQNNFFRQSLLLVCLSWSVELQMASKLCRAPEMCIAFGIWTFL